MDLSTKYLGLKLRTPFVPSASPLSEDLENIKAMEDAGASAVVLHSLFEEQIRVERSEFLEHLTAGTESYPEALTYVPEPTRFAATPDDYLASIARAKAAVNIPIIASLNGSTMGKWTQYARLMQEAGADAIELNIYWIPTEFDLSGADVEKVYVEIVKAVRSVTTIPLAVKIAPYFSNLGHTANQLVNAGADGLVLFNRFYQPDLDIESLEVKPHILLSTSMAMRLPLRWVALLHGRLAADLAATGGIHRATDALKMLMAGADVTMVCSALMRHGIGHLKTMEEGISEWLEQHEYESVVQLKGSLSQRNCPDPSAFERARYMRSIATTIG